MFLSLFKKLSIKTRKILAGLLALLIIAQCAAGGMFAFYNSSNFTHNNFSLNKEEELAPVEEIMEEDYTNLLKMNPERGFYETSKLTVGPNGKINHFENGVASSTEWMKSKSDTSKLLMLKIDLSEFSGNMNSDGVDKALTWEAVQAIRAALNEIKQNDNTIILRLVYDRGAGAEYMIENPEGVKNNPIDKIRVRHEIHDEGCYNEQTGEIKCTNSNADHQHQTGKCYNNAHELICFGLVKEATGWYPYKKIEPSQNYIYNHINTLAPVFKEYSSTINVIQCGFYGLWGECYYNTDVNAEGNAWYWNGTLQTLISATEDTSITIATRTPAYAKLFEGDKSRICVFNDAYGSQEDDMGTYTNREEDITWIGTQAMKNPFGGEAIIDSVTGEIGEFNNQQRFIADANKLHTNYINSEWNTILLNAWKTENYDGDDIKWKETASPTTAYDYIDAHLGYRLVLTKTSLKPEYNAGETISFTFTLTNNGFGNVNKPKKSEIVVVNARNEEICSKEITLNHVLSHTNIKQTASIDLPLDIYKGDYKVFLRASSGEKLVNEKYYSAIALANKDIYDEDLQANYIGSFTNPIGEEDPNTETGKKKGFAVYTNEDNSLKFYKRSTIPNAGETFEGKNATAVYQDIETTNYSWELKPAWKTDGNLDDATSIIVIDDGITPISTAYWFNPTAYCRASTIDLTKLNTINATNMQEMFSWYSAVSTIYIGNKWNTDKVTNSANMFTGCTKLPNFNSDKIDKTNAHANAGGYLTLNEETPPVEPTDPPVVSENYKDYITNVYKDSWGNILDTSYSGKEVTGFNRTNGAEIFNPDTYGITLPSGYKIDQVTVYSYNWAEKATYYNRTWNEDSGWHARLSNYIFKRQVSPDLTFIGGQSTLDENDGTVRFAIIVTPA